MASLDPLDCWPEAVVAHLLRFVGLATQLFRVIAVSRRLAALLSDDGESSTGFHVWKSAFLLTLWSPASEASFARVVVPPTFRWKTECFKRLRLKWRNSSNRVNYLLAKRGWVSKTLLRDGCVAYTYNAHQTQEIMETYIQFGQDVSEGSDTVAVIHARSGELLPDEHQHAPEQARQGIWRTRLPGARRLRYYELEILNPGAKGYIACGAVLSVHARRLRYMGAQPGWGVEGVGPKMSVGFHGDDGFLYPGPMDEEGEFRRPFGPRFSAPGGSLDASLRPAGPPPPGSVLKDAGLQYHRVVGMGMDLDLDCFFFTVDGALVGETHVTCLSPKLCVPAIGLHSPGESVRVNLGIVPFWFPVEAYSVDVSSVPRWENPSQWASSDA